MRVDGEVVECSERSFRGGLTAVGHYWPRHRLREDRDRVTHGCQESVREICHADEIMECFVFHDGRPDPSRTGRSPKETLERGPAADSRNAARSA